MKSNKKRGSLARFLLDWVQLNEALEIPLGIHAADIVEAGFSISMKSIDTAAEKLKKKGWLMSYMMEYNSTDNSFSGCLREIKFHKNKGE